MKSIFTPWLIMWETINGERCWDVASDKNIKDFCNKLVCDNYVESTSIIISYNPISLHWAIPSEHKNQSDVFLGRINELLKTKEIVKKKEKIVKEENTSYTVFKYGWIAPDGRVFSCDYGEHMSIAFDIVGKLEDIKDPEIYLENHGWVKVFLNHNNPRMKDIYMGKNKKLTDDQIKVLQSLNLDSTPSISMFL